MIAMTPEINSDVATNSIFDIQFDLYSIVLGFIICLICVLIYLCFLKKKLLNIEDGVMIFSFLAAIACLFISLFFNEIDKSINILSFFCSFVFSWLLTKKSSKKEFKELQQEIAKTSHRHIGDVKKATLVTKNRLLELKNKEQISKSDIDGILDDVEIILQCITTNEGDWKDMVSKEYLKEMKKNADPEDEDIEQSIKTHNSNIDSSFDTEEILRNVSKVMSQRLNKQTNQKK